jgi:VIT1/CCC1 family predicted Fe2+/Mn2+ transporter
MHPSSDEQLRREHQPESIRKRLGRVPSGNVIGDAVLGGIDGCVTTLAVVAGATGAGFSSTIALVLGLANLIADGFSMAVSNFEAIKARADYVDSLRREEQEHIRRTPDGEREEIRQIFARKGFSGATLETIVETISKDQPQWINTMLLEEHQVQPEGGSPLRSACATFAAFVAIGSVPLLPFLLTTGSDEPVFALSAGLGALMFFSIGSVKSLFVAKPWLRSGIDTLLAGGMAALLAWLTGYLLRTIFAVGSV